MRLQAYEIDAIKTSFQNAFKEGSIYLFGSRVDDNLKGGDIDLYIIPESREILKGKKRKFLIDLKSKIGDQKIDVIVFRDKNRIIEQEALRNGVLL